MFSLFSVFAIIFLPRVHGNLFFSRVCGSFLFSTACQRLPTHKKRKKIENRISRPLLLFSCVVVCIAEAFFFYFILFLVLLYSSRDDAALGCVGGIVSPYNLIVVFSLSRALWWCVGGTCSYYFFFCWSFFLILRYFAPHIWKNKLLKLFGVCVCVELLGKMLCNFMFFSQMTIHNTLKLPSFSRFLGDCFAVMLHWLFLLLERGLDHFPSPFCLVLLLCVENSQCRLFLGREKKKNVFVWTMRWKITHISLRGERQKPPLVLMKGKRLFLHE